MAHKVQLGRVRDLVKRRITTRETRRLLPLLARASIASGTLLRRPVVIRRQVIDRDLKDRYRPKSTGDFAAVLLPKRANVPV
jgi:hypothetical protein